MRSTTRPSDRASFAAPRRVGVVWFPFRCYRNNSGVFNLDATALRVVTVSDAAVTPVDDAQGDGTEIETA